MMLSRGQMNDQNGPAIRAPAPPPVRALFAKPGYTSNPLRAALGRKRPITRIAGENVLCTNS
jgi:hypothetical protein